MPDLWELQEGEPARAFAAFCVYRDLPVYERTLNLAHQISTGKPHDKSLRAPGYWAEWSSEWRWVERAAAYDGYLDSERRKVREAKTRELAERRAEVEFSNQAELEAWLADLDAKLREVLAKGFEEIEREFARDSNGELVVVKEKKRTKFPALGSLARLLDTRHETARQAIEGPQSRPAAPAPADGHAAPGDAPGAAADGDGPNEFVWVKPEPEGEGESGEK